MSYSTARDKNCADSTVEGGTVLVRYALALFCHLKSCVQEHKAVTYLDGHEAQFKANEITSLDNQTLWPNECP